MTIETYVAKYCEALAENFKQHSIDMFRRNIEEQRFPENTSYYKEQLEEIYNGSANLYKWAYDIGKKYYKVYNMQYETPIENYRKGGYRKGSVTAFIDKTTGEVYKPASWKAPHTKHVRFDLRNPKDREFLLDSKNTDWSGGHLYLR